MFKKKYLGLAIAATLAAGSAQAALETSVTLKNETAYMMKDGIRTGEATSSSDTTGEGKGVYKFENTAKIYLNDDLGNGTSWHGELNIVRDTKAIDDLKGHDNYSQQDWLRELYADTKVGDWDVRLGKQQVVWGTADGIKLLDMINPTDWREFNQNTMADARIPVWMINAEKYLDNGGNVQVILSQAESSKIAGLINADGQTRDYTANMVGVEEGAPFVLKGVDTITGGVNGFLNIGGAMGGVTSIFYGGSFTNPAVNPNSPYTTVAAYTSGTYEGDPTNANWCASTTLSGTASISGSACLENFTDTVAIGGAYSNNGETNLIDANPSTGAGWDVTNPNSAWEYMSNATFNTFNTYVGMGTKYVRKDQDTSTNLSTRFRNTTDNGLNYSVNYAYAYDSNPTINIHWENSSGEKLVAREYVTTVATGSATTVQIQNASGTTGYGAAANHSSGAWSTTTGAPLTVTSTAPVTLVFEEKLERLHNIGSSFDFAIDGDNPIVVRGEFLYTKDAPTPVIDRNKLAIGNLTSALTTRKSDFFKYVIGADTTVATDMMLSGQFIQFRNLDYVNDMTNSSGSACGSTANCGVYTGDQASMHLTNGLKKAEENKEFYSIFLSKPFGESGEGRWNNIFIYEEGGGKWNRFDVEYGFDDQLIGTFEVNKYFGDNNTMFGQFENASNVQIGVKYLLQ